MICISSQVIILVNLNTWPHVSYPKTRRRREEKKPSVKTAVNVASDPVTSTANLTASRFKNAKPVKHNFEFWAPVNESPSFRSFSGLESSFH